jgi:hypothetical protein
LAKYPGSECFPKKRISGKNESPTFVWYDTDSIENNAFNNSSIACVFVAAVTFLLNRCLTTIGRGEYTDTKTDRSD